MKRFNKGFQQGYNDGFNAGYDKGFNQALAERGTVRGSEETQGNFAGTSIIIPNYNQKDFLKECIESIRRHTPEPYELIIVDNASTDGSMEYLYSIANSVRIRTNPHNLGFAGAVNQGLNMARGSTLLILNNDTVVTERWLSNQLLCLHNDPGAGIVGPVTNYISGDQLIQTDYSSVSEMQLFASNYNRSDSSKWITTGRLTGFCMLMRREVFERLGYFDEGFEIGNCEDDDYGLRLRFLRLNLVIAFDTFIHHYGSVSMKDLKSRFDQVYGKNLMFYSEKWGDPHGLLASSLTVDSGEHPLRMTDFYPTHIVVQGAGTAVFWVEQGIRYPLDDPSGLQVRRVSEVDLKNWQVGCGMSREECAARIAALSTIPPDGMMIEGMLARSTDGCVFQYDRGKLRQAANDRVLSTWQLTNRAVFQIQDTHKSSYPLGHPIIASPLIKAENL